MVRITTECPRCERVELGTDDITLVVSPSEDNAWHLFDCIGCVQRVVKPAPRSVVWAPDSVHVAVSIVPAEVVERTWLGKGRPVDTDDLLDALLWLRVCSGPGSPPTDATSIDANTNPGRAGLASLSAALPTSSGNPTVDARDTGTDTDSSVQS